MRVLFVTPEAFPLIKTGGLADVAGALGRALAALDVDLRLLLPGYPAVLDGLHGTDTAAELGELFGGDGRLLAGRSADGLEVLAVDAPHLYARAGDPYLGPDRRDWPDNHRRFAALAWVAARIGRGLISWRPELVHAHDWQAGLAPAYLALGGAPRPATVLTIHNIVYQGLFPPAVFDELRLPAASFAIEGVEFHGRIGFLKAGLHFADRITTVSPTYAREILRPEVGAGLDGVLRARPGSLSGILNGIDTEVWDPARDPHLPAPYSAEDLSGKAVCKRALETRVGLEPQPEAPLFGVVSRLTPEKGLDLLLAALPALLAGGGRLVLLGTGDSALETGFAEAARLHAGRVGAVIGYDEGLAHQIQAGADVVLVPSRAEPCGLTQLHALRYGSPPVVSRVGGLADSVIDANHAALEEGVATGFVFAPTTVAALADVLARASALHGRREDWERLQRRAMSRDVGWRHSAERYLALYREIAPRQ